MLVTHMAGEHKSSMTDRLDKRCKFPQEKFNECLQGGVGGVGDATHHSARYRKPPPKGGIIFRLEVNKRSSSIEKSRQIFSFKYLQGPFKKLHLKV